MKKMFFVLVLGVLAVGPLRADENFAGANSEDDQAMVSDSSDSNEEVYDSMDLAENDGGDWAPPQLKGHGFKNSPCAKAKLDNDQKAKFKEALFKFKENEIDLQSQVKKARLNYKKVMTDSNSDLKAADSASEVEREAMGKLIAAKQGFRNMVAFKILRADQREPARICKMMHRHHGWGRRHGHGDDRFANR